MEVDETEVPENQQPPKKENPATQWRAVLPADAGDVRDITRQANWTLSSCKTDGFGIHQLLDDDLEQYWQSDGPQPHTVTIEFPRKTDIAFLMLYLDYKTDESYTPSKVVVRHGSSILDVDEGTSVSFSEPVGWQVIDLRDQEGFPTRAFLLLFQVVQNHQNGRDTHIRCLFFSEDDVNVERQMRVIGPAPTRLDTGMKTLINCGTPINNVPLKFTSEKIARFSNFR